MAVFPREVEVAQGPRGVKVGVGVESLDERVRLVAQVALDLELGLGDRVADVAGVLQTPAELLVQACGRKVGDVANHPCHAHAGIRCAPGLLVVAVTPRWVAHDRFPGDRVPRYALRVESVRAGDRDDGVDVIGIRDRPLEGLHPAERTAGHGGEPLDPERVEEQALGSHHVGDGDHREGETVRLSGCGVG